MHGCANTGLRVASGAEGVEALDLPMVMKQQVEDSASRRSAAIRCDPLRSRTPPAHHPARAACEVAWLAVLPAHVSSSSAKAVVARLRLSRATTSPGAQPGATMEAWTSTIQHHARRGLFWHARHGRLAGKVACCSPAHFISCSEAMSPARARPLRWTFWPRPPVTANPIAAWSGRTAAPQSSTGVRSAMRTADHKLAPRAVVSLEAIALVA